MKNMYVFENVLTDWTSGMVVIVASSLEECYRLFDKEHGLCEDFGNEEGWKNPTVYPMPEEIESGVKHVVYGGA